MKSEIRVEFRHPSPKRVRKCLSMSLRGLWLDS